MTLKRFAISIGVLALWGLGVTIPAYAQNNPASVAEFKDLETGHWAYNAIKEMVEKYQIMEGFPNHTFQGQRTLSRYEMAAALRRIMMKVEDMLAATAGTSGSVPPGMLEDLKKVKDLQEEFKKELDNQTAALDKFRGETDAHLKNLDEALANLKPTGPNVKFGGSWKGRFWYDFDNPKTHYLTNAQLDFSTAVKFNDQLSFDGLIGGTFTGKIFAAALQDALKDKAASTVRVKKALLTYSVIKNYNFKVKVGYAPLPDVDLYSDIASRFGDFGAVYNPFIKPDENPAINPATGFGSGPDVSSVETEAPGGDTVISLSAGWGALATSFGFTTKIVAGSLTYDLGYAKVKFGGSYDQVGLIDAGGSNKPAQTVLTTVVDIMPLLTTKVPDPTGKLVPFDPDASSYNINGTIQINAVDSGISGEDIFAHKDIGIGIAGKYWNFDFGLMTTVWMDKETDILLGGYLGTPKIGNAITLLVGMQDPFFTDKSGTLQEGIGQAGNQAGFSIIMRIDNPVFPNLELEYANSADILGSSAPFRDVFMVRMGTRF